MDTRLLRYESTIQAKHLLHSERQSHVSSASQYVSPSMEIDITCETMPEINGFIPLMKLELLYDWDYNKHINTIIDLKSTRFTTRLVCS